MSALALVGRLPMAEFDVDDQGVTSHHWLFPERAEIIYGGLASLIVFFLLWKYALPMAKKSMAARTARIQKEIDDSKADEAAAEQEAAAILQAKGDIEGERARILVDADREAEQLLVDGRARLEEEVAELYARADADAATLMSRSGDELRAEIAQLAGDATERVVAQMLDASTQTELIESFITKVGAGR
jgi:F-type H+-transporting ATPase subunit b